MAKSSKFEGGKGDAEDIRVALKLPPRGSLQNRQVSNAFKKIQQALRSSSGGGGARSGVSNRLRGQAAAGSVGGKVVGPGGVAVSAKPKPLQRVSVRWTYSKNQGDGQWGAHGRYIERESAQDKELDKDRENPDLEQNTGREPDQPINQKKDIQDDRNERPGADRNRGADRYSDPAAIRHAGRFAGLRQSYFAAVGRAPAAKSFNDLRSLSSVSMVEDAGRRGMLLPRDARQDLDDRGPESVPGLRRGSAGEPGKARTADARVKRGVTGFGSGGPAMPIAETLDAWQKQGDERMFKLIISPEFGERMNLRKHVTELVQQMEKDLQTKLQWVAVDHYNTDHPHVHVAIRGVDDKGRQLEVSPDYISKGSRTRAQELATRELGYRSERDVAEAMERQITQQRFTDIDRTLLKMSNEQGSINVDAGILKAAAASKTREIDYSAGVPASEKARAVRLAQIERLAYLEQHGLAKRTGEMKWFVSPDLATRKPDSEKLIRFDARPPAGEAARENRLMQIRRLTQLTEMGLAEKVGNLSWRIKPAMETALRQMQMSQDRLKTKFAHRELISDPSAPLVATELKALGDRVAGKVVGTGLNEANNRPYILIEGFDGKVHYLSQSAKVQKLRGEGELKAGEYVAIEIVERKDRAGQVVGTMQKIDRHGKAVTPELIDQELLRGGKVVEESTLKKSVAGAFRDAAASRLERLRAAGAVEVDGTVVRPGSTFAHDVVRFEDAGIKVAAYDGKGPILASVLAKGRESIAIAPTYGRKLAITAEQLEGMGLSPRFIANDSLVFIGVDAKGRAAASAIRPDQVPAMVQDRRMNKLDAMLRQLEPIHIPSGHALHPALKERAEEWEKRGIDPHGPDFAVRANVWRKGVELQDAAQQKGVDKVLDELAREKGKPIREFACEPGRQVSGRVVLVTAETDHTTVVVDTGHHLTKLRQPAPAEAKFAPGQRVQARAQEVVEENSQRRMMTWRFADMEREQARKKGREDRSF